MKLNGIDFSELKVFTVEAQWGHKNPDQRRYFYNDDRHIYKIWSKRYTARMMVARSGRFEPLVPCNTTASFSVGLIDHDLCSGLVDFIYDEADICRGYAMEKGTVPEKGISTDFVDMMWEKTVSSGYAHTDFCTKNTIVIGGKFSMIDLDSAPTEIENIDLDFEIREGALRPHNCSLYRERLQKLLSEL